MGIRKSEFVTGLFILAALATLAFVGATPFLKSRGTGTVTVFADFDNVALLKDKAQVGVNGIQMGNVESRSTIEINGKIMVRVKMSVNREFMEKCCVGTIAKIGQESLLGDKFVDLIPSLNGQKLEVENDAYTITGTPYSDMFTTLASLSEKVGDIDELIANANDLLVNVNENFLSQQNANNMSALLTEAVDLMETTNETVATLKKSLEGDEGILANANGTLENTRSLTGKLDGDYEEIKGRLMDTLAKADTLLDSGNARINRVGEILEEAKPKLDSILDKTDSVMATADKRLPTTMDKVDSTLDGADALVRNKDLAAAFYDMRVALQELSLTLRALRADPSQVIFGGPGEAKKALPDPKNKLKDRTDGRPTRYGY